MFFNRPFSHPCIDSRADNTGSSLYFQYTFHSVLHSIIRDRYLPSNGFLFSPPPPRSRMSRVSGPSFPSYPTLKNNLFSMDQSTFCPVRVLRHSQLLLLDGCMDRETLNRAKPNYTSTDVLSTDGECLVGLARQTHTYIQKSKHKLNSSRLNSMYKIG